MIFENNYAYAGTTAIIYNFELDYDDLNFYINSSNKILLPSDSNLIEMGIDYKKDSDEEWNTIIVINSSMINSLKNNYTFTERDSSNYIISRPIAYYKWNHMSPIRIVIKNLEESTTYNIRSYYINDESDEKHVFNYCDATTIARQNVYYTCTAVTGGTDTENERLLTTINKACDIYNSMTAFTRESSVASDSVGTKNGGSFTARLTDVGAGVAANSGMNFGYSTASISTVCHEMAHNLMKSRIDETYSEQAYNEIVKFMEFATHGHKATWRWNNAHNYPVISSASYTGAFNYLVAAACYICRKACNKI